MKVWKRSCFAFGRVGEKYMILCDITHVNACTKLDTYLCSLLRGPYNLSACRQRNDIGLQYGLEGLGPRKSGLSMLYTCPDTLQFLSKSESYYSPFFFKSLTVQYKQGIRAKYQLSFLRCQLSQQLFSVKWAKLLLMKKKCKQIEVIIINKKYVPLTNRGLFFASFTYHFLIKPLK